MLVIAEVLGHLLIERGLEDRLVRFLSSPSGPVSDRPCSWASRTSSTAACYSADGSAFFFATSSSVVITAPSSPSIAQRVRPETLLNSQSHLGAAYLEGQPSSALRHEDSAQLPSRRPALESRSTARRLPDAVAEVIRSDEVGAPTRAAHTRCLGGEHSIVSALPSAGGVMRPVNIACRAETKLITHLRSVPDSSDHHITLISALAESGAGTR